MDTLENLYQDAQLQYAASTGTSAKKLWSFMLQIITHLQEINMNTTDPTLKIENDALKIENETLKKKIANLDGLLNYTSGQLQQFGDALKLSNDLTIPQKIQKAKELVIEIETLRTKK